MQRSKDCSLLKAVIAFQTAQKNKFALPFSLAFRFHFASIQLLFTIDMAQEAKDGKS